MADICGEKVAIAGSGEISGGVYESVRMEGAGKIGGDVEAKTISIAGYCEIEGSAKAEEVTIAGYCKVTGSISAGEMKTEGNCFVKGNVKADIFKCSGSQEIGGQLSAKYARIAESCRIGGDVEADKFVSEGSFRIAGLLSADEIDIRLGGNCRALEIGGERISVRRTSRVFAWPWQGPKRLRKLGEKLDHLRDRFGVEIIMDYKEKKAKFSSGGRGSGMLETELIEGDDISIEWTIVKTVRGKQIVIGAGCEVEQVEYSESLEVDDSAKVRERVKI